jgi:hypothetical protein
VQPYHITQKSNSSNSQCAKCATPSDARYKNALVEFFKAKTWHWAVTIPIGLCEDDDSVLRRLRHIEAMLNGKFQTKRFHKLSDQKRFSMVIAFEGQYEIGTRHAHILVHVPTPIKKRISRSMMIALLPQEFRSLWTKLQGIPTKQAFDTTKALPWESKDIDPTAVGMAGLHFETATIGQVIYAIKSIRLREVPWSRLEFVTPPRTTTFTNQNLSVVHNRNQQRRKLLGLH